MLSTANIENMLKQSDPRQTVPSSLNCAQMLFSRFVDNVNMHCAIAEANKNQPLITINMVKFFHYYLRHVKADSKVISIWQPYTDMSIPH